MEYESKYIKYKNKYLNLIGGRINKITNDKPILLVGYAASGKSTIALQYEKDGYYKIDTDEIIKTIIEPKFGKDLHFYSIYNDNFLTDPTLKKRQKDILLKVRNYFIKFIKSKVKKYKKVIIEGQLRSHQLIRSIFRTNDEFIIYIIRPPNVSTYIKRITQRFINDPLNYGRLGFLYNDDIDGEALKDFQKNGIDGKIIKAFAKDRFPKHEEVYQSYLPEFNPQIIVN